MTLLRAGCLVRAELLGGSLRLGVELRPDYGGRERWAPELVREPAQLAEPRGDGFGGQPDGEPAVTEGRRAAERRPRLARDQQRRHGRARRYGDRRAAVK